MDLSNQVPDCVRSLWSFDVVTQSEIFPPQNMRHSALGSIDFNKRERSPINRRGLSVGTVEPLDWMRIYKLISAVDEIAMHNIPNINIYNFPICPRAHFV